MTDTAILGRIVKAVGLKGEVKLYPSPDFWLEALEADALEVLLDDAVLRTVRVSRSRPKGETYILKLEGIDTIEAAKITGITPPELTRRGRCDDCPP